MSTVLGINKDKIRTMLTVIVSDMTQFTARGTQKVMPIKCNVSYYYYYINVKND